eukprot:Gb_10883 [translate_table: standard]
MDTGGSQLEEKVMQVRQEVAVNFREEKAMEEPLEPVTHTGVQTGENPSHHKLGFAKKLASGDKKTRDKAIALLKSWLTSQENVAEEALKKIWKGLFYCLWHADKQPAQADLIEKFASLLEYLNVKLSRQYFKVFLLTMGREWNGIDHARSNKFNLLFKEFVHHMFIVLNNNCWDSELTKGFMEDLTEQTFQAINEYPAQGITFHIVDMYLNELHDFLPLQLETFMLLIEPFYTVLAKSSDKPLLKRVKGNVFDCLLEKSWNLINAKQEGRYIDDKEENLGSNVLMMGTTSRLFKLATFSSTFQANRTVLYELHEEFSKLDRVFMNSGMSIDIHRAKKPKIDDNISADKSSEVSDLASEELADSATDCQAQPVDAMENIEEGTQKKGKRLDKKGKSGKVKKVPNGINRSSEDESNANASSELCKNNLLGKELKNTMDEVCVNDAGLNHDFGGLVKEGELSGLRNIGDSLELNDSVISNLEQQFEKAAAEMNNDLDDCSSPLPSLVLSVSPLNSGSQKRKRVISAGKVINASPCSLDCQENDESAVGSVLFSGINSATKIFGEKSVKKVTFSLKNNLVWKPYNPLPPHSLRVPPSATPRGSALKKGVPPGPVCIIKESPSPKKITSRKRCTLVQKRPKSSTSTTPRTKLLRKQR